MTHEAKEQERYRGVLCGYCRQPIPVPSIVKRIAATEADSSQGATCTFQLRCRACEREKPYRTADICEFEGSPRSRSHQMQGPVASVGAKIARAAHA